MTAPTCTVHLQMVELSLIFNLNKKCHFILVLKSLVNQLVNLLNTNLTIKLIN